MKVKEGHEGIVLSMGMMVVALILGLRFLLG
jgi:hypothetical protein